MYELISFVTRGKVRKAVFMILEIPRTPTQVSEMIGTHRSTTSRAILSLENKGLVECINPNDSMGRYYRVTELGMKVLMKIKEWNGEF
ncbi:MAG: helix-turn-helix domain-containing protein [Methanobacterium sp.]